MREAPRARLYTSLGQRPRSLAQKRSGLKARLIPCNNHLTASGRTAPSVAGKTGMRPIGHRCVAVMLRPGGSKDGLNGHTLIFGYLSEIAWP